MLIPTTIDHYPDNLTWEDDDGTPAVWCNSEEKMRALESFVSTVLLSESIDECLPLSEPLDDLCLVSAENLFILKKAFQKSGALLTVE
jgi:hypothetical protein